MKNSILYPLQFAPIFKYRIWGGEQLKTKLNKNITEEKIGESWEISAVSNDETHVLNGQLKGKTINELIKAYGADFLGENVMQTYQGAFPLLIKFIDAALPLSIQVHPHDALAKERHQSFGKNEMWYIMEAEPEAEIIVGFNQPLDKNNYQEAITNNTILSYLNTENTQSGDVFNIPTGRVHAIGAGVMLAEIQQSSDITYRMYDYDRIDSQTGTKRELHNNLAIDTIDFTTHTTYKTPYISENNKFNSVVKTPYFTTNIMDCTEKETYNFSAIDSFIILMVVEGGSCILTYESVEYEVAFGSCILLPASIEQISIHPKNIGAKILMTHC